MSAPIIAAEVYLWGSLVGYVAWDSDQEVAAFEYDSAFLAAPVEPSPLHMPRQAGIFAFKALDPVTFKGLPGMLADSLPDKFGNALIDMWLAKEGRTSLNPVERLCYIGTRGMGALEFKPSLERGAKTTKTLAIDAMVELASEILTHREAVTERFAKDNDPELTQALTQLLAVGTSAGGARAKCIIAYNPTTGEVRSGQVSAPAGFGYYILKLDGVSGNKDKELADPKGFGRIEYAYHLMAKDCGIVMTPCTLLEEKQRAHFMTQRFDRLPDGGKLHMQSLCAIAHYDFNLAGAYGYEQAMQVIRKVVTHHTAVALEQQYRRTVLNVVGRNQDDHTKNIAFLMDKQGTWSLAPAYDVTYSYNPDGAWTSRHQMTVNGKRDHFTRTDLLALAKAADLSKAKANKIIDQVIEVMVQWPQYAAKAGIDNKQAELIRAQLRLLS